MIIYMYVNHPIEAEWNDYLHQVRTNQQYIPNIIIWSPQLVNITEYTPIDTHKLTIRINKKPFGEKNIHTKQVLTIAKPSRGKKTMCLRQ